MFTLYQSIYIEKNFDELRKTFIEFEIRFLNIENKQVDKKNVDEIVNMVFDDGDRSHFNSAETLWEGIHSEHYKYPEEVKILEARLMINSYRKGWKEIIDSGDFKMKYSERYC